MMLLGTLGSLKLLSKNEDYGANADLYFWLESIACGLLGFLLSYILSIYIDKKVDLSNHWTNYGKQILVVFLAVQFLYSIIVWPILHFLKDFAEFEYSIEIDLMVKIGNGFYFASLFGIWLFAFLTIKIYHQLKSVQLKQLQLESNLKESQLNTLKGQINPHFMFNSLNNIRGLMLEDVGKARDVLTNLSETLRYSLTKSDVNSIALEDELEMVESYVEIAKIQFEDRLKFELDIQDETLNKPIPPMIIQMLIENALKHGIAKLKKGGIVRLLSKMEGDQLTIQVSNSGKIAHSENTTHLGVQNIKKRLELLYGNKATFKLKESEDQVIATILIPMK